MYWDYGVVTGVGVGFVVEPGFRIGIGFLMGHSEGILTFIFTSF